MLDVTEVPGWLSALLSEKFFNACLIHEESKKNEKNVFCLDCCDGICPHCLTNHRSHRLLQVRRYVYHDVIRLVDADKLIDCANVQSYTNNSAKVVFLNQRPQTRPPRASGNLCVTCDRNLQESFLFCCISCKLQHILETGCKLSKYIRKCEFMALPESGLDDDGQMTPESVLERSGSLRTESGSSGSGGGGGAGFIDCQHSCSATTEVVVKKKRSSSRSGLKPASRPVSEISEVNSSIKPLTSCRGMNRSRKGTPYRSPL